MFSHPLTYVEGLPSPSRCLVMGVVNVTPDSFSDGGRWASVPDAVDHGLQLHEQGADLVDVGGESTRPSAARPSVAAELARVLPVISELVEAGAVVTIDTMRAEVAARAVEAGASAVNDVSGGLADPDMLPLVAELAVPYICMHWRGHADSMQTRATYHDVVRDVVAELRERTDAALAAGIDAGRLALDPGLGFAKTAQHNWALLTHIADLSGLGRPLVIGASRKTFLGALLESPEGSVRPVGERDDATAVISALCATSGVWCVRVHDVAKSLDAVRVASRWAAEASSARSLDRLSITGLRAYGYHGVLQAERQNGQEFLIDVSLGVDARTAAGSDRLSDAVDYGALTDRLAAAVTSYPVDLIETLAQRLADVCLASAGVAEVEVTVHKPSAPLQVAVDDVSVTIIRRRDD